MTELENKVTKMALLGYARYCRSKASELAQDKSDWVNELLDHAACAERLLGEIRATDEVSASDKA